MKELPSVLGERGALRDGGVHGLRRGGPRVAGMAAAVSGMEYNTYIQVFLVSQIVHTLSLCHLLFSLKNVLMNMIYISCLSYIFCFLQKLNHMKCTIDIPTFFFFFS